MKLNAAMRDAFIDNVMDRVPMKSEWNQKKISAEITRRLKLNWPGDLAKFVGRYPEQVNWTSTYVGWLGYQDKDGDVYRNGRAQCLSGYSDLSTIQIDDLKRHWQDWLTEQADRKTLRSKLTQQARSANTTEQLAVIFPDLTGLIPKEEPKVKNLPVAAKGLIDELKAAGMGLPV